MNGRSWMSLAAVGLFLAMARAADPPPVGFQPEVTVSGPTRLDWEFAASPFGAQSARLPPSYNSRSQRYQLFVPKDYTPDKTWPLVVFISPGDDPLGWRWWQKPCERHDALFCAAYGAGNNTPPGQRVRIVLDMLDDVRRHYRVDPKRTYLTGFSGGGRMACTIAYSLPGLFGGVAPVCGTNPLPQLAYLRHRVADRLSVAFVTGEKDFNRSENEVLMAPLFGDLGIRSRLWVVKGMGHAMPGPEVLNEVYAWLEKDLRRRQQESARPGMALAPDEAPTARRQAARLIEAVKEEMKAPEHTWRAAALLQGVVARWSNSDEGDQARKLLEELQADPKRVRLIAEQGGAEERRTLTAQARAFERLGDKRRALQAWRLLAKHHPDAPEGKKAADEARRLADALAATPYLGIAFAGDTVRVAQVVPKGPADRAGIKPGDVLVRWGGKNVASLDDLRRALANHKPGDKVQAEVKRSGQAVKLTVELAATPTEEKP